MRLIDADALTEKICGTCCAKKPCEFMPEKGVVKFACVGDIRHVVNAPTIEAEPVKHGRWIVNGRNPDYVDCTNCGLSEWIGANGSRAYAETLLSGFKKYCPNCGARMDGKPESEVQDDEKC